MTDIVERLWEAGRPDRLRAGKLYLEAADEIERLRGWVMQLSVKDGRMEDEIEKLNGLVTKFSIANMKATDDNEGLVIEIGELRELIVDFENNAIVGLRAVNILDESNVVIRHGFQFLVGEKWIDVPVENVWEKADD